MYLGNAEKCFVFYFWHPVLVRPAMKRLFCLKAKNGLGRLAPSALPHYNYVSVDGVEYSLFVLRAPVKRLLHHFK